MARPGTTLLFTVENLRLVQGGVSGKPFWAAEIVVAGARVGVDKLWGSWMTFEQTDGSPLTLEPGPRVGVRQEVNPAVTLELQKQVRAFDRRADEAVSDTSQAA